MLLLYFFIDISRKDKKNGKHQYNKFHLTYMLLWILTCGLVMYDTRMTLVGGSIYWSWIRLAIVVSIASSFFTLHVLV